MDKLPQEIFDHVVSYIYLDRPIVAAISRKFQHAVERLAFRCLYIDTTDEELGRFERILTPRRFGSLRKLTITVVLPSYPPESFGEYETDEDRRANSAVATATLRRLFGFMGSQHAGTPDEDVAPWLHLELCSPFSPSDRVARRFAFSSLDIASEAAAFSALPCVRKFTIRYTERTDHAGRKWVPSTGALLTPRMPNLETVNWDLEPSHESSLYYSLSKMYRDDLSRSICSFKLPKSVNKFVCEVNDMQYAAAHRAEFDFPADDPVSLGLRELTKDCSYVSLKGWFGPALFACSTDTPQGSANSYWQNTTELHVDVVTSGPRETPSHDLDNTAVGRALEQLAPGYGATEGERKEAEKYYDNHHDFLLGLGKAPDKSRVNALVAAFGYRCSLMPALQLATLYVGYQHDCYNDSFGDWMFEASCVAPGKSFDDGYSNTYGTDSWRVYFLGDVSKLTEVTLDAFRAIGKDGDRGPPTMVFLP
ncbi:hypothetical protein F5B21DRAFT_427617 [Xylaria acuta]|nr:hypothetical protein F5B21DRAFT_427617 [Xylaria acuta]